MLALQNFSLLKRDEFYFDQNLSCHRFLMLNNARKIIIQYVLVWDNEIPPRGLIFTVKDSAEPRPRP